MQSLSDKLDKQNEDLLFEYCVGKIHELHKKSVKTNIEKGRYAVAGGHTIYNSDMHDLFKEYNKELKCIDFAMRHRAQTEFENEMLSESKMIMDEDKTYSNREIKETITTQLETIKQDFVKMQEENETKFKAELDLQNKRYKNEMENMRKEEREREKRETAKLRKEISALRDAREKDHKKIARLKAKEEFRQEEWQEREYSTQEHKVSGE